METATLTEEYRQGKYKYINKLEHIKDTFTERIRKESFEELQNRVNTTKITMVTEPIDGIDETMKKIRKRLEKVNRKPLH